MWWLFCLYNCSLAAGPGWPPWAPQPPSSGSFRTWLCLTLLAAMENISLTVVVVVVAVTLSPKPPTPFAWPHGWTCSFLAGVIGTCPVWFFKETKTVLPQRSHFHTCWAATGRLLTRPRGSDPAELISAQPHPCTHLRSELQLERGAVALVRGRAVPHVPTRGPRHRLLTCAADFSKAPYRGVSQGLCVAVKIADRSDRGP